MAENPAARNNLIRIRPRPTTFQTSRGRTCLTTTIEGEIREDRPVEGLYIYDTRMLSRYKWLMNDKTPDFSCSSSIEQWSWCAYYIQSPENCKETPTGLCNPLEETVELRLMRQVGEGMHEDVYVSNHTQISVPVILELQYQYAFTSQSEAESGRKQCGDLRTTWSEPTPGVWEELADYRVEHPYRHQDESGLAKMHRGLLLRIENATSAPQRASRSLSFSFELPAHGEWHACLSWFGILESKVLPSGDYTRCRTELLRDSAEFSVPHSHDLSAVVDQVLQRSKMDLAALRLYDLDSPGGVGLAAGIPTYQEIFGRDMLAAAWQASILTTDFLRGSLSVLGPREATETNEWRDMQPGRLPHEIHTDPLSVLGFRPKNLYFGTATASFLYPIAVAELLHWSGDLEGLRGYLKPAMNTIRWADHNMLDETGFYRYKTHSEQGVKNQGWKDSEDAIVYPDGKQVSAPIGTCEMQGFMYVAKLFFSEVMWRAGERATAGKLFREALDLKKRFNDKFWMEDEQYFALGIDDKGEPIRSIASDPGQCLLSGIVDQSRVKQVAARMMRSDLFSGWGIRTLSADHPAYNPFAYHRGTVWPVTNAGFILAFARYGLHGEMHQLAKAFFESCTLFEHYRIPEVFGGHPRSEITPFPGIYTQADWPQAWSASAPFTIIQALLGVYPYAPANLLFLDPHLPEWLPTLTIERLQVGKASLTIRFERDRSGRTRYEVLSLTGPLHLLHQPSPWSITSGWGERVEDFLDSMISHRAAS